MHSDQKYLTYLQQNDRKGIEEIYRLYAHKVGRMIVANQGTIEDAGDIFQEALIDILKRCADTSFQLTCPFEAYLIVICKRKWLNLLKTQKKAQVTNIPEQVFTNKQEEWNEAERLALQTEQETTIMQLLDNLSQSCKDIIKACIQNRQQEQIAKKMGISYAYLRKKKSECMAGLGKLVKKHPLFK